MKKKILFADDSKTLLQTVRKVVEESGHVFLSAASGIDALCLVADKKPDLVFIDVACPDLDGFQFCALLRQKAEYRNVPVYLLSTSGDIFERARAEVLGAQGMLLKPFGRQELLAAIDAEDGHGK